MTDRRTDGRRPTIDAAIHWMDDRRTVCIARQSACLLIALTTSRDRQNIVDVSYHTLVEQDEWHNICSNFCTPLVFMPPITSDSVGISERLVIES